VFAVAATWTGLIVSYTIPKMPPTFAIVGTAALLYAAALATRRLRRTA
jgi:ABC-type Mn2+/Zn2+ transport system permease subunit